MNRTGKKVWKGSTQSHLKPGVTYVEVFVGGSAADMTELDRVPRECRRENRSVLTGLYGREGQTPILIEEDSWKQVVAGRKARAKARPSARAILAKLPGEVVFV